MTKPAAQPALTYLGAGTFHIGIPDATYTLPALRYPNAGVSPRRRIEVTDSPSAELRAAAEKLRNAATLANAGPWIATPDVLIGGWAVAQAPMPTDEGPYLADFVRDSDARYVAAMHPGVGAALATLLERQAKQAAEIEQYLGDEFQDGALDQDIHDALAVARALLGTQPDGSPR